MSLSSIGSGSVAPTSSLLEGGGAKKKKSLLSADYKEAVNSKSKIEGIAISTRIKNKKGKQIIYKYSTRKPCQGCGLWVIIVGLFGTLKTEHHS